MTHYPNLIIVVRKRWEVGVKFLIGTSHWSMMLLHIVLELTHGAHFLQCLLFFGAAPLLNFEILVIFDTVRLGRKMQFTGREFSLKTKTKKTTTFSMQSIHPSKSNSSDLLFLYTF